MADKDIEKVNKLWYLLDDIYSTGLIENEERDEYQQALGNVLEELETKIGQVRLLDEEVYCLNIKLDKKDNEILAKDAEILDIAKGKFEANKENFELKLELETWKKTAEKLAEELAGNDDYMQNIIEWARKEVGNEQKNT